MKSLQVRKELERDVVAQRDLMLTNNASRERVCSILNK